MRWRYFLAIVLLVGCGAIRRSQRDHLAEPTPANWQRVGYWRFVLLRPGQSRSETVVLRFSDGPAKTCYSGRWRVADVVSAKDPEGPFLAGVTSVAYLIEGPRIDVDLTPGVCDGGLLLVGRITEAGARGSIVSGGLVRKTLGHFAAVLTQEAKHLTSRCSRPAPPAAERQR